MRSAGQEWALKQLSEISSASADNFEIVDLTEPAADGASLDALVSISCRHFKHKEGGVPLRVRERLRISIPSGFPLFRPDVHFTHKRYADFPHVQWGDSICLYQAPEVEWQASRGMFGFMQRLDDWLRSGAAGELDPIGMPLHPPVTYPTSNFRVVPCENTPDPGDPFWCGYVEVTREDKHVAELGRWISVTEDTPSGRVAMAILLPAGMPHEYPTTMLDLLKALMARGVDLDLFRRIVNVGVLSAAPGQHALFVLGAAMRGVGGGKRLQHLASWRIEAEQTAKLKDALIAATPENPVDVEQFFAWALDSKVEWCRVLEDRPEIVERRDLQSPASWWRGKRVSLLGCGAIGSAVAMMLARAGVAKLHLVDNGEVTPGILVRQGFDRRQVGYTKASALRVQVQSAIPAVEVEAFASNVLHRLADEAQRDEIFAADVIIDATASPTVAAAIESHFRTHPKLHPPILSMVLGHNADIGMMTMSSEVSVGCGFDLDRRSKIAFASSIGGRAFLDEFWPTAAERRKLFQPEPGCSSPTFRGSHADVLALSARMTNVAANWLQGAKLLPRTFAVNLQGGGIATGPDREKEMEWNAYQVLHDGRHGYEVRMTPEARAAILTWVRRSERTRGDRTETGGVLFGQIDEYLKIVWIDEVSGPPPDSLASPEGFVCGIDGVAAMHAEKTKRTLGSVSFTGMWHTHPQSLPVPSATDLKAMKTLMAEKTVFAGRAFVMLIVGGTSRRPIVSVGVFERSDYVDV